MHYKYKGGGGGGGGAIASQYLANQKIKEF